MEKVLWKVEGMTCSNCALTIHRYLEKEGLKNVKVNAIGGEVSFDLNGNKKPEEIAGGIRSLGYQVAAGKNEVAQPKKISLHLQRFLFCLPFTLVLMLHMLPGVHIMWLMNPWIQLLLTLPVYIVGMRFFGKSAIKSLQNGVPNMNVLIALGATAAFIYSFAGHMMGLGNDYLFYETAATIITLVFLGNYLEDASIQSTQKELKKLASSQKVMANMIAFDEDHHEHIFPMENTQLKSGDLILIKSGEQVPADCKILWGDAQINESIITGESLPVHKIKKDKLIGGSIVTDGTVKAQVTAVGDDTVLANILTLVKQAQGEKPPVQQMADKISAIFVPVVIGIALLTLVINWLVLGTFTPALMRSIAVLVIACPCAMGLATPAAIAVGLGRGARNGILFRNATSLELFRDIQQVVFDKTGTLTTGKFKVDNWQLSNGMSEADLKKIVYSLEKYSNHPIAKSISAEWKTKDEIRWKKIEEVKGYGMKAEDKEGNIFEAASYKSVEPLTNEDGHSVYVTKNGELLGWINVADEIREEAAGVINYLKSKNIKTILLSGDRLQKTKALGDKLGIDEVIAEQTPEQKLQVISRLANEAPTVMVGDGINDAPALAKATVGVSMSDATQVAMQSAQVVLMNHGLKNLPSALGLGRHTYKTIQQNLFWAFSYNIIAIPVAALGFLTPSFGALVMALSDVVLAINSARLFVKKVV
jgi:copper-(or silver)-translocating P-type ATPase/heavy metal-(Cd/Co/Hg/Pb/Zn)-translocating P-type ATPase